MAVLLRSQRSQRDEKEEVPPFGRHSSPDVVAGNFSGTTAAYYARYRRSYPDQIITAIVDRLHLGSADAVVDLGCGTGLLTVPLAGRVQLVVGVDPEPDMLAEARRLADPTTMSRIIWVLGSDADLPAVAALRGRGGWGAVTVGQALHFMDIQKLVATAREMLRPGGGLAVISNGIPLWQQDSHWSQALKAALEDWFQTPLSSTCGTSNADRTRYRSALSEAGFAVEEAKHEYTTDIAFADVIGGLFSAISPTDVPEERREAFVQHLAEALAGAATFTETVPVTALIAIAI
jgi:ubiquinone/menaquinone biosynthesis C-methylase UbiE